MTEGLIDSNIARWLEPAGVQLDNERVPLYRAAVDQMSGDLAGRELAVARAAHHLLDDSIRAWIGEAMRQQDQGFVAEGKDALLSRLAGIALIRPLPSSAADPVVL